MLAPKIDGKLTRSIIEPRKALEKAGEDGILLSMVASWHRALNEGKEYVDMADFSFLIVKNGKPLQIDVSYEEGDFTIKKQDLSKEMGDMKEEEEFFRNIKVISDAEAVKIVENDEKVKETMKKAKHLRVFSMEFVAYDEDLNTSVWKLVLKNWPLTNYFKREKPVTINVFVDAISGKILGMEKII